MLPRQAQRLCHSALGSAPEHPLCTDSSLEADMGIKRSRCKSPPGVQSCRDTQSLFFCSVNSYLLRRRPINFIVGTPTVYLFFWSWTDIIFEESGISHAAAHEMESDVPLAVNVHSEDEGEVCEIFLVWFTCVWYWSCLAWLHGAGGLRAIFTRFVQSVVRLVIRPDPAVHSSNHTCMMAVTAAVSKNN